jgi:hypothetical protein
MPNADSSSSFGEIYRSVREAGASARFVPRRLAMARRGDARSTFELHKVLVPPRGLFASGKFDQYKRDIPYSTLAQAFQTLIRPLLGKSEAELAAWRDLQEALGPNGGKSYSFAMILGEHQRGDAAMSKILVLYYSAYGHIEKMAEAVAEGARAVPGTQVTIKRVPNEARRLPARACLPYLK